MLIEYGSMNTHINNQLKPNKLKQVNCPLDLNCYLSFACCNNTKDSMPSRLTLNKGDVIFKGMGDEESSSYIILSGVASAICHLSTGEVVTICLLGKGNPIGEIEPFFKQKIYYVIQALTPMTVCHLSTHDLIYHIDKDPDLLRQVFTAVENNSHAFARQLWVMNAQRLHERIERFLSVFIKLSGSKMKDSPIRLSHSELAALINTDRPSVTRALHKLADDGFVKLGYNKLWVIGDLLTDDLDLNVNFRFDPLAKNIPLFERDRSKGRPNFSKEQQLSG